jgi:hypothetical protein
VELEHGLEVWRLTSYSSVGYDVLAGIVTFGWAVPEEEAVDDGCAVAFG